MLSKLFSNKKGSFTIEATIIFSILFLVIISILYMCLMLYQQVYLQTFVDRLAFRAANNWSHPSKDMMFGFVEPDGLNSNSLYWRIYETDSSTTHKIQNVKKFGEYEYGRHSLLFGNSNIEFDVKVKKELLVHHRIVVSAKTTVTNPVGKLLLALGMGEVLEFSATSDAMVNEPAEFIRNVDFAIDTVREIDNRFFEGKGSENFVDKINETMSKFLSKIQEFF